MKNFKKITSLVLALCMAFSVFTVSAFAATEVKDAISFGGKVTSTSKTLAVKFTIPDGLTNITGVEFSVDFVQGFTVADNGITSALPGWQIDSNFPTSKIIVIHSTDLSTLESIATAEDGKYTIATITVVNDANLLSGTYGANITVCDITSGTDHHANTNTTSAYAAFEYEKAHVHSFEEIADARYLKSPATCTKKAVYYKSCSCGEASTETFESGEVNPANHTGGTYLVGKKAATYTTYGYTGDTYCSSCRKKIATGKYTAKLVRTSIAKISVSGIKTKTYTGKSQYQYITVKYGSKTLVKGRDYTYTYYSNVKPGKATVKITGIGAYTGTVYKYFYIYPKKVSISTVKSYSKKTVKVKWKKDSTVTGYQIKYAKNSKFSSAKTVTVTSYKTYYKTIKSLSSKKNYYVKVRAYKTISGKKYYGAYSSVKKAKIK